MLRGSILDFTSGPTFKCAFFGPLQSDCWAQLYEQEQYGHITRPGDVGLPTPAAPQTIEQMTIPGAWTPEQATGQGYAAWVAALRARIQADEDAGTYSPEGRLPFTAEWLDKYKWWLLGSVGGLGLLIALKR